jgi:hypothetical protein
MERNRSISTMRISSVKHLNCMSKFSIWAAAEGKAIKWQSGASKSLQIRDGAPSGFTAYLLLRFSFVRIPPSVSYHHLVFALQFRRQCFRNTGPSCPKLEGQRRCFISLRGVSYVCEGDAYGTLRATTTSHCAVMSSGHLRAHISLEVFVHVLERIRLMKSTLPLCFCVTSFHNTRPILTKRDTNITPVEIMISSYFLIAWDQ